MKKVIILFAVAAMLTSCSSSSTEAPTATSTDTTVTVDTTVIVDTAMVEAPVDTVSVSK